MQAAGLRHALQRVPVVHRFHRFARFGRQRALTALRGDGYIQHHPAAVGEQGGGLAEQERHFLLRQVVAQAHDGAERGSFLIKGCRRHLRRPAWLGQVCGYKVQGRRHKSGVFQTGLLVGQYLRPVCLEQRQAAVIAHGVVPGGKGQNLRHAAAGQLLRREGGTGQRGRGEIPVHHPAQRGVCVTLERRVKKRYPRCHVCADLPVFLVRQQPPGISVLEDLRAFAPGVVRPGERADQCGHTHFTSPRIFTTPGAKCLQDLIFWPICGSIKS